MMISLEPPTRSGAPRASGKPLWGGANAKSLHPAEEHKEIWEREKPQGPRIRATAYPEFKTGHSAAREAHAPRAASLNSSNVCVRELLPSTLTWGSAETHTLKRPQMREERAGIPLRRPERV